MRIATVECEAKEKKDYEPVDKIINFTQGQSTETIVIKIKDDDDRNTDRDFYLQLYDANDNEKDECSQACP